MVPLQQQCHFGSKDGAGEVNDVSSNSSPDEEKQQLFSHLCVMSPVDKAEEHFFSPSAQWCILSPVCSSGLPGAGTRLTHGVLLLEVLQGLSFGRYTAMCLCKLGQTRRGWDAEEYPSYSAHHITLALADEPGYRQGHLWQLVLRRQNGIFPQQGASWARYCMGCILLLTAINTHADFRS